MTSLLPLLSKSFAPNPIAEGGTSTLTFTIDNTGEGVAAFALSFADSFPAGLVIGSPPNASTTCAGGTLTASAGATGMSYTGGTAAAMSLCTVTVDIASDTAGDYANTSGELTSSLGNSGTVRLEKADARLIGHQPGTLDKARSRSPNDDRQSLTGFIR